MTRYRILDHTADTGIEAEADSLSELLEALAYGMFDLTWDMEAIARRPATGSVEFTVSSPAADELTVDLLSELLYRSEAGSTAIRAVSVDATPTGAKVTAETCSVSDVELCGPPIKAVTYHDLRVERADGSWRGRVIFDV